MNDPGDDVIRTINGHYVQYGRAIAAVRKALDSMCWEQPSKGTVAGVLVDAIQNVDADTAYKAGVLGNATQTVITEIYTIENWPTTKEEVEARAVEAIRRRATN